MNAPCSACGVLDEGMINLYKHPKGLDEMFLACSGSNKVRKDDLICTQCYNKMCDAFEFRKICQITQESKWTVSSDEETQLETKSSFSRNMMTAAASSFNATIMRPKIEFPQINIIENPRISSPNEDCASEVPKVCVKKLLQRIKEVINDLTDVVIAKQDIYVLFLRAITLTLTTPRYLYHLHALPQSIRINDEHKLHDIMTVSLCKSLSDIFYKEFPIDPSTITLQRVIDAITLLQNIFNSVQFRNMIAHLNIEADCFGFDETAREVYRLMLKSSCLLQAITANDEPVVNPDAITFKEQQIIKDEENSMDDMNQNYNDERDFSNDDYDRDDGGHPGEKTTAEEDSLSDVLQLASFKDEPLLRSKRGRKPKEYENDIFCTLTEIGCEYCFAELADPKEIELHLSEHLKDEKPYRCPKSQCTIQFKYRYELRKHYHTHTNAKRFKCRYCEQRFHQRGNALAHERYHTGEKPFLCSHCGKTFAESGNLKTHMRHHTGERPFKCSECPKTFTTHYSQKVHARAHSKERPYVCSQCGKDFSTRGNLVAHDRIHTGVRPYECNICPSKFSDSNGLKRHLKIHDSESN